MKLLAVSLVAAAATSSNHTAVYGVHPPGLGAGVFSGLMGWPGSTFSNQITLSRHYALGTNASNYYYNARGVFPRLDDGRLIRDAYDRRERPGKKRRGPESPADWRRVPRRRPAAAA